MYEKQVNMISGINKYIGTWESKDGYQLVISKTSTTSAIVSFYNPTCQAIIRPYFDDKPSTNMLASYDDYSGEFKVDLWEKGKGFELYIEYELHYKFDQLKRDALVPAISRYEKDDFLDKNYRIFGALKHFIRVKDKTDNIVTGHFTSPY